VGRGMGAGGHDRGLAAQSGVLLHLPGRRPAGGGLLPAVAGDAPAGADQRHRQIWAPWPPFMPSTRSPRSFLSLSCSAGSSSGRSAGRTSPTTGPTSKRTAASRPGPSRATGPGAGRPAGPDLPGGRLPFTFLLVWVSPLTFGFIHLLALAGPGCLAAAAAGPAAGGIQRPPAGHGSVQQGQSFSAERVCGRSFPLSDLLMDQWHPGMPISGSQGIAIRRSAATPVPRYPAALTSTPMPSMAAF
jgi:hypothetical protein